MVVDLVGEREVAIDVAAVRIVRIRDDRKALPRLELENLRALGRADELTLPERTFDHA
jgi:hypothetical protein